MKVALVVPHIFMHRDILPNVIFSPGTLAIDIAEGLELLGADVTLCTPGPINSAVANLTADLSGFESELAARDDTYIELLKKHPMTFITLARQVQSELLADVFTRANAGEFDIVHVYTNEEDTALPFAKLCNKPVVFTHHDPFNFLVKYRSVFPKYSELNWLSISLAQRSGMPEQSNWVGNVYHGLPETMYHARTEAPENYVVYMGRIIEPKGVHLAIQAVKDHNQRHPEDQLTLKIAGKHYSGDKDTYWQNEILPQLDTTQIEYIGFAKNTAEKQALLEQARALIIPSTFDEPFGMVMIESLACGTPVIGMRSGAIPEVITDDKTGILVSDVSEITNALSAIKNIDRATCRTEFETRFTQSRMCEQHLDVYKSLIR